MFVCARPTAATLAMCGMWTPAAMSTTTTRGMRTASRRLSSLGHKCRRIASVAPKILDKEPKSWPKGEQYRHDARDSLWACQRYNVPEKQKKNEERIYNRFRPVAWVNEKMPEGRDMEIVCQGIRVKFGRTIARNGKTAEKRHMEKWPTKRNQHHVSKEAQGIKCVI